MAADLVALLKRIAAREGELEQATEEAFARFHSIKGQLVETREWKGLIQKMIEDDLASKPAPDSEGGTDVRRTESPGDHDRRVG